MPNRDLILLETVKTHRARLTSAFVFGELQERRVANDNLRRLVGGIVLAAVLCAGCVGFSFVSSIRSDQAAATRAQSGLGPATGAIVAADTFDRRAVGGWGTAERGGTWRMSGPAGDYAVADGAGTVQLPEGELRGGFLPTQLQDRSDVTATVQRTSGGRDGSVGVAILGRRVSSTQDYRANVQLAPDGSVALSLSRRGDPGPSGRREEGLSPTVILLGPDEDQESGPEAVTVRVQVIGTSPATVRAKAWAAGGSEPTDWTVNGSDSSSGLQRPGSIGFLAVRTGGSERGATLALTDIVARVAPLRGTTMTNFTRLTVVGSARKAELVVPDDESIGGLLPRLMELLDEPSGSVARPLTLVRATGEQLDASLSSAQQELADGEQLRLVRTDDAPAPPEVADVTDVVGDSYADRSGRWSTTAREAVGATAVGATVTVALLAGPLSASRSAALLVVATGLATLLGRLGHRWLCLALTASAAGACLSTAHVLLAGPGVLGTGGRLELTGTGPTLVLWAAVTAALVWVVIGFGVGAGLRRRSAVAGAVLGAGLTALPVAIGAAGVPSLQAVAVGALAATVASGLLPWYALSSSGLSGLDDQVLAGQPGRRTDVLHTVDDAYRSLSWSTFAVAGVLAVTASLLLVGPDRWTQVLGLAVTGITALRSRAFPLVIQQTPLVFAATAATLVGVLARRPALEPAQMTTLLLGLTLVVVLGVGVHPAAHQRAQLRRWGNLAEAVLVIALLPLVLGVFGVYGDLVEAFR